MPSPDDESRAGETHARLLADQTLDKALAFASAIVDTMREPLVVLDGALHVQHANRAFYRTFRVSPEHTEGHLLYSLGNGQWDIPGLRAALEEVLPAHRTFDDFEVEHDFPAIGPKLMRLNARRLRQSAGSSELILLAIEDVTEQRRAEAERDEINGRFASLVRNIRDHAIFTLDADGVVTRWNIAAERVLRWTEAEAVGRHFSFIFTPEDREQDMPAIELETARREGRAEDERWHLRQGGERFWASGILGALHDSQGRLTGFAKILRDMTARKHAEDALRASEARYRLLFEHMIEGFALAELIRDEHGRAVDWRYLEVNPAWAQTGVPVERTVGRTAREVNPAIEPYWIETYARVVETGEPVRFENFAAGFGKWFETSAVKHGEERFAMLFRDVTERREAEEALRESVRHKDEFIAMLSHELRNPLAPISSSVQLLRTLDAPDPVLARARDVIDRQVAHLGRLVDDLLDASRVSRGKVHLQRERVDLAGVVRQAVEIGRPAIEAKHQSLDVSIPAQPLPVEGDAVRLAQVLSNLLNNAARYTGDGGRIAVTVTRDEASRPPQALVRVSDSGRGIDAAALPHVFELFYQGDRALDRPEGGLGIGLSLARSIVDLHGGSIEAASAGPGRGSVFVVRLPLAASEPPADVAAGAAPSRPARTLRLLVVDDNRDAADSLAMLLALQGHEVSIAYDGVEACDMALAERPQVVLLDIGLPRRNGYEACRTMREGGLDDVVIVALTGYGQSEDRRRTEAAGFDAHLVKPVDFDVLDTLLRTVVRAGPERG